VTNYLTDFLAGTLWMIPGCALLCIAVVAGQVMTRMSLNFCGMPGARPKASNTCVIVFVIWLIVIIALAVIGVATRAQNCAGGTQVYNIDTGENYVSCPDGSTETISTTTQILSLAYSAIWLAFFVYFTMAVCFTRAAMRRKYQIKPSCCGECDDCCFSFWCSCCVVSADATNHDWMCLLSVCCLS
jgi:hypothetical protein